MQLLVSLAMPMQPLRIVGPSLKRAEVWVATMAPLHDRPYQAPSPERAFHGPCHPLSYNTGAHAWPL